MTAPTSSAIQKVRPRQPNSQKRGAINKPVKTLARAVTDEQYQSYQEAKTHQKGQWLHRQ